MMLSAMGPDRNCWRRLAAALALLLCASAQAGALSCHGEQVINGSEWHQFDLTLRFDEAGRVNGLAFDDMQRDLAVDNELAVHACSLDTAMPATYGLATWSGSESHQRLDLVDAFAGASSEVRIVRRAHSYSIQFGIMSPSYCGQMVFPAAVVIADDGSACSLHFRWPEHTR